MMPQFALLQRNQVGVPNQKAILVNPETAAGIPTAFSSFFLELARLPVPIVRESKNFVSSNIILLFEIQKEEEDSARLYFCSIVARNYNSRFFIEIIYFFDDLSAVYHNIPVFSENRKI